MSDTKNIILGTIGVFIIIYVACIGMNIYSLQTHKNELNHVVSRAVEHGLKTGFRTKDEQEVLVELEQEITESLNENSKVSVDVKAIDMQKGLLSVEVTEEFTYITGKEKRISQEKTAIMDQRVVEDEFVRVSFMVDGEIYKEFELVPGEDCPLPALPDGLFSGWVRYGEEQMGLVESIEAVWEDQTYLAVLE